MTVFHPHTFWIQKLTKKMEPGNSADALFGMVSSRDPFKGCWWLPTIGDEKVTAWITAENMFVFLQNEWAIWKQTTLEDEFSKMVPRSLERKKCKVCWGSDKWSGDILGSKLPDKMENKKHHRCWFVRLFCFALLCLFLLWFCLGLFRLIFISSCFALVCFALIVLLFFFLLFFGGVLLLFVWRNCKKNALLPSVIREIQSPRIMENAMQPIAAFAVKASWSLLKWTSSNDDLENKLLFMFINFTLKTSHPVALKTGTFLCFPGILILKIFDPPKKMLFKITQLTFFQFVLAPGHGGRGSWWTDQNQMVP